MASLELLDVQLTRAENKVLAGLSWSVPEGQVRVALIGRNGAGKSSVCRLLNGMLLPDSGHVYVCGQKPLKRSAETLRRVGFLFQNPEHQLICPTVVEEIAFSPIQFGFSKREANGLAFELLEQYGLEEWKDRPVAYLSHGQKKVVCLLSVLVNKPEVLVLDEPFAGMDLYTQNIFNNYLADLEQLQIVVSHQLEVVASCERVCCLEGGRIVKDGTPEQVIPWYRAASKARGGIVAC